MLRSLVGSEMCIRDRPNNNTGGGPTPLNGTDVDPRNTLLSWATEGDNRTPSHPTDQYPDIDYSDAAFLSKFGGNPLSTAVAGEVSQPQQSAEAPETVHIEVASLFSLIPAEETSQFSFGGRKRVANPFGGRKNKGKLDRSIVFQPNNSWKEQLPTPPPKAVDSAGDSSTTNNGSAATATTKDVISLEGRSGKKENPLIKYLKNDLEEEAASDGGSSTVSSADGGDNDTGKGGVDAESVLPTADNDPATVSGSATTTTPTPALSSITSIEDQQRKLDRKVKRQQRREEREARMREELEVQYRARVAAAAQRKEMNKQALRDEMRKALLSHPSIVAVARSIGLSVIQTSERLADPCSKKSTVVVGTGSSLMESATMRGWPGGTPNMGVSPAESQPVSPDTSCNVSGGGGGQLFNIVLHQSHSSQSNGGGVGNHPDHTDSIGASLLGAETKTTATALSNNNSLSDPRSAQPQEDWLVAVANDLLRYSSEVVESPLSPVVDENSPPVPKSAVPNPPSLSKGEELLIDAVNKMYSSETKALVDAVVEELPRNRRKQQAAIKSRNERCVWGMYHNPVLVKLADAVAAHVGNILTTTQSPQNSPSSSSTTNTAISSGPPPSHSILFTGRSIVVEDPTSVTDPAYTDYLTPMAIDQMLRIPKRCSFTSRAHIPCTPARSQVASTSEPPTSNAIINNNDSSMVDVLTTTQVPVLVAGISSWGRMPGSSIPKSIKFPNFRAEVEGNGTATTGESTDDLTNLLSSMQITSPTSVHLASSPSMTSALSHPETTYIKSTHRSHAVVSFKPTVTLLTTKMASDCVVSISVPSAVMTTKRRKRSQNGSQSVVNSVHGGGGAHSSVTSLFSLGSDDVDTITNLVVHPVPYPVSYTHLTLPTKRIV
eukprot:TRINITY_DN7172_c0_g1_i4.p1 TRINITY_DN7172_c0_g1~~TRINITY_DN7172_c0_g1_i4.p1  ORF type:complete len:890 (-),score=168.56 TRINITY_DN7172_c0_g1_i4:132-2801(-)